MALVSNNPFLWGQDLPTPNPSTPEGDGVASKPHIDMCFWNPGPYIPLNMPAWWGAHPLSLMALVSNNPLLWGQALPTPNPRTPEGDVVWPANHTLPCAS